MRARLLHWYDAHRRDLPWRRSNDPYAKWVAEIMLQQTRVDTVIPYYDRFIDRFPDVGALARANHDAVLKHWEGLGYYRRALHLHRSAAIVAERGGSLPTTVDELRRLPGVGPYVAAAIASMAFRRRVAAVDGNVRRVIARLFTLPLDVRTPAGAARVDELARQLLSPRRPGDFNQAWMDLGSRICTPKNPACAVCPLRRCCVAAETGSPQKWPARSRAPRARPVVQLIVALIVHRGSLLVRRRPRGGLWSGLWEFPNDIFDGLRVDARAARRVANSAGVAHIDRPVGVGIVTHQLTHRTLRLHVYTCRTESLSAAPVRSSGRWAGLRALERISMSTAHRRVLELAEPLLTLR